MSKQADTTTATEVPGDVDMDALKEAAERRGDDTEVEEILTGTTIEVHTPKGVLAIDPTQKVLTPDQIAGFRSINIEADPANPDHVPYEHIIRFLHVCQVRELDPALNEAYLLTYGKRHTSRKGGREIVDDKRKFAVIVGIDGYRTRGEAQGDYAGQIGPQWVDEEGVWHDHWNPKWGTPVGARVGIMRRGFDVPVWGVAMYAEFVPMVDEYVGWGDNRKRTGNKVPTEIWQRMPAGQNAKVAEAQAWRKAYPRQFSGTYAPEEMDRAKTEYEEQQAADRRQIAAKRRQDAYQAAQAQVAAPEGDSSEGQRDKSGPVRVAETVQGVAEEIRREPIPAGSEEDRAGWLRAEISMLARLFDVQETLVYARHARVLGKLPEEFTADELFRVVQAARARGVEALRRAGRDAEAEVYQQAVESGVVPPVEVLLGRPEPEATPPADDVDASTPHPFVNDQGVCAVPGCERLEDDIIHSGGG